MRKKRNIIKLFDSVSSFAENKDIARQLRYREILIYLEKDVPVIIDFSGVELTTQSFIHALIAESIRKYGEPGLALLEFKSCKPQIKSIVRTVVNYSLEFSYGKENTNSKKIMMNEIPQANKLDTIKVVLKGLKGSTNIDHIAEKTGFSKRHISYRLSAARVLGFLDSISGELTENGKLLLSAKYMSEGERKIYINAIEDSRVFQIISPDLLEDPAPSNHILAKRIVQHTNMSLSTAIRRANTLTSWKKQVGTGQMVLDLFDIEYK